MGLFKGVEGAKGSFDAAYMGEGHYLCRIDRLKADKTRSGDQFLAVEMTVVHVFADGDGEPDKWHKVGNAVSHLMMAKHDSFLGNVKSMIANLLGVHESEVTEADCDNASGAGQPLSGIIAEVKARGIMTRAQKPFTKISYVREFPASEIQDTIDEKAMAIFFPGDTLDKMIEREAEGS